MGSLAFGVVDTGLIQLRSAARLNDRSNTGTVFKLADGKVTVRVMESGGGRSNYLRVSIEGKGSVDATGKLSSDAAATHIPIDKDSIRLIGDVVKRYTE